MQLPLVGTLLMGVMRPWRSARCESIGSFSPTSWYVSLLHDGGLQCELSLPSLPDAHTHAPFKHPGILLAHSAMRGACVLPAWRNVRGKPAQGLHTVGSTTTTNATCSACCDCVINQSTTTRLLPCLCHRLILHVGQEQHNRHCRRETTSVRAGTNAARGDGFTYERHQ